METVLSHTQGQYREIFNQARNSLLEMLGGLREQYTCEHCVAQGIVPEIEQTLHSGCGYRQWQEKALEELQTVVAKDVLERLKQVNAYKETFNCSQCGVCCRIANSEYSYEELQAKAEAGDDFARQFTSVFLPYASVHKAQEAFPEIVTEVQAMSREKSVYFYHCPYVGEDNRCTIFGNPKRPAMCGSYPDTALTYIQKDCAWKPWQEQTLGDTMLSHAVIQLCEHYSQKIEIALN